MTIFTKPPASRTRAVMSGPCEPRICGGIRGGQETPRRILRQGSSSAHPIDQDGTAVWANPFAPRIKSCRCTAETITFSTRRACWKSWRNSGFRGSIRRHTTPFRSSRLGSQSPVDLDKNRRSGKLNQDGEGKHHWWITNPAIHPHATCTLGLEIAHRGAQMTRSAKGKRMLI